MKKGKTKKDFENYINKVIKKYTPILLLGKYKFEIENKCDDHAAMQCTSNYPYLDIIIGYSDDIYRGWAKGDDVLQIIIHEMCHAITHVIYMKALDRFVSKKELNDEYEHLTDLIANIVYKNNKKQ